MGEKLCLAVLNALQQPMICSNYPSGGHQCGSLGGGLRFSRRHHEFIVWDGEPIVLNAFAAF